MIIFTFGINEMGVARIRPEANGQPNFFVDGSCGVLGSVDLGGQAFVPLVLYGPQVEQPPARLPAKPTLLFNQIADADSHATALKRCQLLCDRLKDLPVLNHPAKVMKTRRDDIAERLRGIEGLRVPRVVRCAPRSVDDVFTKAAEAGLDFPFIFRTVGEHNGSGMELLTGPGDRDRLYRFALDGTDHYLVEFVDTADSNGVYHRQRIIWIDGEPVAKSVFFNEHWIVNSSGTGFMKQHPEYGTALGLVEDLEQRVIPAVRPVLDEILRRVGLDFFGMDCHVGDDGVITLFEANANMAALSDILLRHAPDTTERTQDIRRKVRAMIDRHSGYVPPRMDS